MRREPTAFASLRELDSLPYSGYRKYKGNRTPPLLDDRKRGPDRTREIEAELQRLRRELDRFVTLIADSNAPKRVLEGISSREQRTEQL